MQLLLSRIFLFRYGVRIADADIAINIICTRCTVLHFETGYLMILLVCNTSLKSPSYGSLFSLLNFYSIVEAYKLYSHAPICARKRMRVNSKIVFVRSL